MKNPILTELVHQLKKKSLDDKVKIWRRLALDLEKPSRKRRNINLYKLNKFTKEGDVVAVPGNVLSIGDMEHKITVGAYRFSVPALEKLKKAGCTTMSLKDLMSKKLKKIRVMG